MLEKKFTFRLTKEQTKQMSKKGIRAEHLRQFIATYGLDNQSERINSSNWQGLKSLLEAAPSLQVVGDVGSGKSYLTKLLIKNDADHIYIVLDAHNEYPELIETNNITPGLKHSCRIKLLDQPTAARAIFSVYYNLVTNNHFPENFVLVVEESLRYKTSGIVNLLAESRKFLKVLAISQERLVDFCPCVKVEPYNQKLMLSIK